MLKKEIITKAVIRKATIAKEFLKEFSLSITNKSWDFFSTGAEGEATWDEMATGGSKETTWDDLK